MRVVIAVKKPLHGSTVRPVREDASRPGPHVGVDPARHGDALAEVRVPAVVAEAEDGVRGSSAGLTRTALVAVEGNGLANLAAEEHGRSRRGKRRSTGTRGVGVIVLKLVRGEDAARESHYFGPSSSASFFRLRR